MRERTVAAKTETCRNAYAAAIRAAGGIDALMVLSSYTYIDDPGTTPMGPGRHVYTEWGTKDGVFVAEVEEHNGVFTYRIPEQQTMSNETKDWNAEEGDRVFTKNGMWGTIAGSIRNGATGVRVGYLIDFDGHDLPDRITDADIERLHRGAGPSHGG